MKCLPLLLLLIGSFALTAKSDSLYHRRYVNCDHGYSVQIPAGVVAHGSDPPMPNHGFAIDMRSRAALHEIRYETSPDWLYVGAASKVHDLPEEGVNTPEDEIDYRFDDLQKVDGHPDARILSRWTVSLGGLRASRARIAYNGRVKDWTIAFRSGDVYEITLTTDRSHYRQDRVIVDKLIAGFKLLPWPKGECSNAGSE